MAALPKLAMMPGPAIDPELKEFIDECLVPMLVRDALAELRNEIHIAPVPECNAQSLRQKAPATAEVSK